MKTLTECTKKDKKFDAIVRDFEVSYMGWFPPWFGIGRVKIKLLSFDDMESESSACLLWLCSAVSLYTMPINMCMITDHDSWLSSLMIETISLWKVDELAIYQIQMLSSQQFEVN